MIERRTTKAGDSKEGLAVTDIPSQTGIGTGDKRKRIRASKRLLVGDGGNILAGLASFS